MQSLVIESVLKKPKKKSVNANKITTIAVSP